jgi:hypothetical protein
MNNPADALKLVRKYGVSFHTFLFIFLSSFLSFFSLIIPQTHIYSKATLGGMLEQVTTVEDTLFETYSESSVSQKLSASLTASISADGEIFSGGLQTDVSYDGEGSREDIQDEQITASTKSSSLYSYGGAAFDVASTDFEGWASTIGKFFNLLSLPTFFSPLLFLIDLHRCSTCTN